MARPIDLINKIRESGWDDGPLYADELDHYFDEDDQVRASAQEIADQQAARVVELEKELDSEREKVSKLIDQNYNLMMNAGSVRDDDSDEPEPDESEPDDPVSIDDLEIERRD